jgi:hypothetical protein
MMESSTIYIFQELYMKVVDESNDTVVVCNSNMQLAQILLKKRERGRMATLNIA